MTKAPRVPIAVPVRPEPEEQVGAECLDVVGEDVTARSPAVRPLLAVPLLFERAGPVVAAEGVSEPVRQVHRVAVATAGQRWRDILSPTSVCWERPVGVDGEPAERVACVVATRRC